MATSLVRIGIVIGMSGHRLYSRRSLQAEYLNECRWNMESMGILFHCDNCNNNVRYCNCNVKQMGRKGVRKKASSTIES